MSDLSIGFVTQLGMDLPTAIKEAGSMGFDHIEVMMDGASIRTSLADDADALTGLLEENALAFMVHLPFKLDIGSPHEHVREGAITELEHCLDAVSALGGEKAVLHASSQSWMAAWEPTEIQARILAAVRHLDGYAADRGIELCVENIPEGFLPFYDFDLLFSETDAAMTLDTGHARVDGFMDEELARFVGDWRDRISHFHLNDVRQPQDEHLPFGAGLMDFETVLSPLQDSWEGSMSLEVFTHSYDYLRISKEKLEAVLDTIGL